VVPGDRAKAGVQGIGYAPRSPQRGVVPGCTALANASASSVLLFSVADVLSQRREAALLAAIAGGGAIGLDLAQALDRGIPGHVLTSVSTWDLRAARDRLVSLTVAVACVRLDELEALADIVIE
jgi:hypothetical protein